MCLNNTSSECRRDTVQGLAYTIIFILGMLLQIGFFHGFFSKRGSWTDTHIYMFNLAVADSTHIFFLPFRIYDDIYECLPKTFLCTFLFNMHYLNMYASILTTAAVSVHRYVAVRFPIWARSWSKKKETACAVCLLIWGLLLTICTVFREENYPRNLWTCFERCKNIPLKLEIILLLLVLGFLLPLLILVFCSSQIIHILLKQSSSPEKKGIIGIVIGNLFVFVLCFTPINVAYVVNYLDKVPENWQSLPISVPHKFYVVSEWIASTNCCFDSISYYFLLKHFYSQQ